MVVVSQVGERRLGRDVPVEYSHELVYEYQFGGRFYRNERLKRRENPFFKDEDKITPEVERFAVGSKVEAFVNPEKPEEAVLEHETKAPGYSIWFPGLVLFGGLGIVARALLKMLRKQED